MTKDIKKTIKGGLKMKKTWVYRVIWEIKKRQIPDGHIFAKYSEAVTYAGIEQTQNFEVDGLTFFIETVEFVQ